MNKQTEEQTEGDQSGVIMASLITLMSYCVYMYTKTGLTWVELFMDEHPSATFPLYIETDLLRDIIKLVML